MRSLSRRRTAGICANWSLWIPAAGVAAGGKTSRSSERDGITAPSPHRVSPTLQTHCIQRRFRRVWRQLLAWDEARRKPVDWPSGDRHEDGVRPARGSCAERGNLSPRCQGRSPSGRPVRRRVPMRGTGTDGSAVRRNGRPFCAIAAIPRRRREHVKSTLTARSRRSGNGRNAPESGRRRYGEYAPIAAARRQRGTGARAVISRASSLGTA